MSSGSSFLMISMSLQHRFRRIAGESHDEAGIDEDAGILPRQQHLPIFGDLVLPLLGRQQVLRVDVFQPDIDAGDAGTRRLRDEVRDLVAHRVDLDNQPQIDLVPLANLNQPIEDQLPILVAGKIIVGDEKAPNAVGPVPLDELFDIVRRAATRLATLNVDDRAERALEWTAAAGVEARVIVKHPTNRLARQIGRGRGFERRKIVHVISEQTAMQSRSFAADPAMNATRQSAGEPA